MYCVEIGIHSKPSSYKHQRTYARASLMALVKFSKTAAATRDLAKRIGKYAKAIKQTITWAGFELQYLCCEHYPLARTRNYTRLPESTLQVHGDLSMIAPARHTPHITRDYTRIHANTRQLNGVSFDLDVTSDVTSQQGFS
jgi:hypothetical protein